MSIFTSPQKQGEYLETIHIVLATDENYIQHAGVMIASLLHNKQSSNPIIFYVLSDSLSADSCVKIRELVKQYVTASIKVININTNDFKGYYLTETMAIATYFRLIIPAVLPVEVGKVLYIDVDMVVRKDITKIWDININNYYVAAVEDFPIKLRDFTLHKLNLGMSKNEPYFNAGLLLINLNKWRKDDISSKVCMFIKNNPTNDQEGLNALLWGKWLHLKPEWNVMEYEILMYYNNRDNLSTEIINAAKDPNILHFTGGAIRPWYYGCINPYAKEYWKYLEMTPWKEYSKTIPNGNSIDILMKFLKFFIIKHGSYNFYLECKKLLVKLRKLKSVGNIK